MATGGDGYQNFYARGTTQGIMDQVVADYITAHTPLSPAILAPQGPDQLHLTVAQPLPGGDPIAVSMYDEAEEGFLPRPRHELRDRRGTGSVPRRSLSRASAFSHIARVCGALKQ